MQKQTEATRESSQITYNKQIPPTEVTVLNKLPGSINHQNEKDIEAEQNYRGVTFLVTTLSLAAVVVYTVLVYWQFHETTTAQAVQQAVIEARLNR